MLDKLCDNELIVLLVFCYTFQLDDPSAIFESEFTTSIDDNINVQLFVDSAGRTYFERDSNCICSFDLSIDIGFIQYLVAKMMKENPKATPEEIKDFTTDNFLLQLAPQYWTESQEYRHLLSPASRDAYMFEIHQYAKSCGVSACTIYEKFLMPLLSFVFKKEQSLH